MADFLRHPHHRLVEPEAGLDAHHQQVEGVREGLHHLLLALPGAAADDHAREEPPDREAPEGAQDRPPHRQAEDGDRKEHQDCQADRQDEPDAEEDRHRAAQPDPGDEGVLAPAEAEGRQAEHDRERPRQEGEHDRYDHRLADVVQQVGRCHE